MRLFGSTAKVLAKCKLEYYRISECEDRQRSIRGTHAPAKSLQCITTALHSKRSVAEHDQNHQVDCLVVVTRFPACS